MGYGTLSSNFIFVPRYLPAKPPTAPRNVVSSTDRTTIYIEYDALVDGDDGGSAIEKYNIYIDDGMDGAFLLVTSQTPDQLTWTSSSTSLTLSSGLIYKLKYSAKNVHGEGPLSDEVSILVAERPSAPTALVRIAMESLVAGQIRIEWRLPADEGGDPVTGYLIYLDDVLYKDARGDPTLNEFTYTTLNVAQMYKIGVSAINDIGEGLKAELNELAASVPMKLSTPTLVASSMSSVTVSVDTNTFNGGDAVTLYAFRRDSGPTTAF